LRIKGTNLLLFNQIHAPTVLYLRMTTFFGGQFNRVKYGQDHWLFQILKRPSFILVNFLFE